MGSTSALIFHALYRELVQALYGVDASRYVFCVNVDAMTAALLLALPWNDCKSGALTERDLEKAAITEERCEAVIFGCAGIADLASYLSREAGVPVIDGGVAGVRLIEALAGAGFKTSKADAYAMLRKKHPA